MANRTKKYLFDILQSIEAIFVKHLEGVATLEELDENLTALRAIEREFAIIGEATNRLRKLGLTLTHADWIVNFRNSVVHQYDQVSTRTIYAHVHEDLPAMKREVEKILASKE